MSDRPETARLPLPSGPARDRPGRGGARAQAAFSAQLQGQGGVKRGLRGGPPVLAAARAAYLEAEFSGPADRRLPAGTVARKVL